MSGGPQTCRPLGRPVEPPVSLFCFTFVNLVFFLILTIFAFLLQVAAAQPLVERAPPV